MNFEWLHNIIDNIQNAKLAHKEEVEKSNWYLNYRVECIVERINQAFQGRGHDIIIYKYNNPLEALQLKNALKIAGYKCSVYPVEAGWRNNRYTEWRVDIDTEQKRRFK